MTLIDQIMLVVLTAHVASVAVLLWWVRYQQRALLDEIRRHTRTEGA